MKIEHYISQLLYRYQCVIVPGFGAFLTEIQPAQLNENANAFYPPKKLISFNSHLKNNDGLLAHHIAQSEKIAYESAVDLIQDETAIWKNNLLANGKFSLKNIGALSLNTENNLVFAPSENLNYLTGSFGLSSFISPIVKREIVKEETIATEEKAPFVFVSKERKKTPYVKYAAIFILTMTIAGSVGFQLHQNQIAKETLIVETEVQKQVQNKIQEATFFIENPLPAVTLAVKEEKFPYHVVAGVYRSEENAQNAYNLLRKSGFKSRRIQQNKHGFFPVLYGSYPTYPEARKAMINIQKTNDPAAWLMIKEF